MSYGLNHKDVDFILSAFLRANFEELKRILIESKTDYIYNNRFSNILFHFPNILSKSEMTKIYQFFLLENWHHDHENIISMFQIENNESKETIDYLLKALDQLPDFYDKDEDIKYPYIRKIIYAIGAQPEPDNLIALEKITFSEDNKIRELALHQIEKRKRLGRWETKH